MRKNLFGPRDDKVRETRTTKETELTRRGFIEVSNDEVQAVLK